MLAASITEARECGEGTCPKALAPGERTRGQLPFPRASVSLSVRWERCSSCSLQRTLTFCGSEESKFSCLHEGTPGAGTRPSQAQKGHDAGTTGRAAFLLFFPLLFQRVRRKGG